MPLPILPTRIVAEVCLPAGLTVDPDAHDAWFRTRVQEALVAGLSGAGGERETKADLAELEGRLTNRIIAVAVLVVVAQTGILALFGFPSP